MGVEPAVNRSVLLVHRAERLVETVVFFAIRRVGHVDFNHLDLGSKVTHIDSPKRYSR